jgi:PAS domain S-box-containing protein
MRRFRRAKGDTTESAAAAGGLLSDTTGIADSLLRAVEHLDDGLYALDRGWRFTYLNRSVEAFVGRSREALLGRVLWEAFPELLGTEVERAYRRAAAGAGVVELEVLGPASRRWVSARLLPTAEGLTVSFRDVTERRRADDALRESEARLRAIVDSSLDGVLLTAPDGRIFSANPAACRMFQRTEAELIAGGRACVLDPADPRAGEYLAARERAGLARSELTLLRKDGSRFAAEASSSTFAGRDGEARCGVTVRDLSTRAAAEAALRLLTEAGRVLPAELDVGASIDAIAQVTVPDFADSAFVDLREDERLHRVVAARPRDRVAREAGGPDRPIGVTRPSGVTRVLETGEPEVVPDVTAAWLRASGEADAGGPMGPTGSVLIVPLAARGTTFGVLSFVRRPRRRAFGEDDVALARGLAARAALALENARRFVAAVRAREQRDATLGVVSHDLRNPLNTIGLNARLLRRHAVGPDADAVEAIRAAVARADRLVHDLIAVTAIESGHLPLVLDVRAVGALVEEVAALHRTVARERSVAIETRVDDALPGVNVDGHRAVQALSNLLGNAIRFAPAGSAVTLRARREGSAVAVDVVDRGPGIPAEQLPHLFERYWQGRPDANGSVGLGLAIAKGTAEAHGGALRVASVPGEGATFTLVLPAAVV